HLICADRPGVVTIYDVYDNMGYLLLVLDLCDGSDLFRRIRDFQAYEDNEALVRTTFLSLLDAVSDIHSCGIVHRDLKRKNILVNYDGSRLFLSDFGLATDAVKIFIYGWGTGIYMSPEASGRFNGQASYCPQTNDIWPLGIILINMPTGQVPWTRARNDD
ncbi:putative Ran1 protein, partial [Epithele typhae]|uniref:putative Ran1 protein n=1 Tax=Epithele typhae TaxID=378194 RepID=UPI002008A825